MSVNTPYIIGSKPEGDFNNRYTFVDSRAELENKLQDGRLTRCTPADLAPRPLGTWRGQVEIAEDPGSGPGQAANDIGRCPLPERKQNP